MKKGGLYLFILVIFIVMCLTVIKSLNDKDASSVGKDIQLRPKKLYIVTTLFPLFDFVKNLVNENAEVVLLISNNADPHSYEPKPSEIIELNRADLIIYAGEFVEPHLHRLISVLEKSRAVILDVTKQTSIANELEYSCCQKSHTKKNKSEHKHDGYFDPHIWLDFDNVKVMVRTITETLSKVDPAHSSSYERNSINYIAKISALDKLYIEKLSSYERKKIIHAGHYSFGYLTKRYGIDYISVQDPFVESELSISSLVKAIEEVKKIGAKYVFYEELETSRVAEFIGIETGARLLLLNSAHSMSTKKNKAEYSYISIMEENLQNLVIAFQAQSK